MSLVVIFIIANFLLDRLLIGLRITRLGFEILAVFQQFGECTPSYSNFKVDKKFVMKKSSGAQQEPP
jgi:hypothetical protein